MASAVALLARTSSRRIVLAGLAACGLVAALHSTPAEAAGDRVRKIVIVSGAQAADPQ